jgi:transposase InsO family protein
VTGKKQAVLELNQSGYSKQDACKALGLSRSSYYRLHSASKSNTQKQRKADEGKLIKMIVDLKAQHPFWGYRRIWAWLKFRENLEVNKKRVYRLLKENDLLVTTKQYKVKRKPQRSKPKATRINQFWGTDMTKFFIQGLGWVYLVVVLDWRSKKIIGYKLDVRSRSAEWIDALEMAVQNQCPNGSRDLNIKLVSDNGSQPTSKAYMKACHTLDIKQILTSYNNPKGNADTERFMRTFKEEAVWPYEFETFEQAKDKVQEFLEFYNEKYPNSALGYMSPRQFETKEKLKEAA